MTINVSVQYNGGLLPVIITGAFHINGLIRHSFVRLALLSSQYFKRRAFRISIQHRLPCPPAFDTLYYYDR